MRFLAAGYFSNALVFLIQEFERWHYVGPFLVLMACGFGLPLPEEVTLVGCGYLVHRGLVDFVIVSLVCSTAILLGDSIPYWLGRRYGLAALRVRWVARFMHPERLAKVEQKFQDNRNWAIFTARFLPVLRIPAYFTAGTFGMSYPRMLALDSLGVLISVPTSIKIAQLVFRELGADDPHAVAARVSQFNHYILAIVAVGVLTWVLVRRMRRRNEPSVPTTPGP